LSQRLSALGLLRPMARRSFGKRLGDRLRARREAHGLSQAKLAELACVTPNYVGLIERGERLPTLDTLVRLAKALDVEPGELLGRVKVADEWLDEMASVAATVPRQLRAVALAMLRTVARS
jgi:transcriptional regulator with XRE-family HTH domain